MDFATLNIASWPTATGCESQAKLVVCEASGRWASALRRQWPACRRLLQETRSSAECLAALAQAPGSLAVIELQPGKLDARLDLLMAVAVDLPAATSVIVTTPSLSAYEWVAREAGAIAFITAERHLRRLSPLIETYFSLDAHHA